LKIYIAKKIRSLFGRAYCVCSTTFPHCVKPRAYKLSACQLSPT
jgi:hypothetical protein